MLASIVLSTSLPAMASASSVDNLISNAKSYTGKFRYVYGGTSTTTGMDCSAYTQLVFKNNGTSIPRTTRAQYATGTPVSKSNLQKGDLVFFNTSGRGVSHVGIYIGNNNFIHNSTSQAVMISSIYDRAYWGARYIGARRVKNFSTPPAPKPVAKPAPAAPVIPLPTRADIASTLAEKLELEPENKAVNFVDVTSTHPNIDAIAAVAEAGIFTGNQANQFMPEGNLTRAQMAKVLVEAFELEGSKPVPFTDVADDHYAKEYIETLYFHGITVGVTPELYGTNDKVSEKHFNTFIERAVQAQSK